ncbi:hypothetical protein BX070DRAFT_189635 [Coemansia spiralis]|nr:hypothetical protein BX070DRAFT_189635 [Coemansia spiralis]
MDSADTPASLSTPNVNLLSPSAMSPGPDTGDVATKNLLKATSSFKVLTEIPIIVVSIIQANRRHADPFVNNILPLILHMLELNPKSSILQNDAANYNWRSAHADLITAQSKTLSFLAFFALGFTALLIPCQDRIARLTLQLLCLCPSEATATRKEMLIATRRIVSTEIRKAFVPLADKFLDMQVLVGSGLASQCILKPFAFSMLADLMHHIRSELSPSQLTRMVDFYAGCMHDQSLSSGVHTMCAKLLHYITECIMNIPDKKHSRVLLLSILKAFVSSFIAIGNQADTAISDIKSGCTHAEEKIYGSSELIRTNAFEQGDKLKELRFLLRSLVTGCKNVIYALRKCDSIFAVEAEIAGFELDILTSLFREGLRACRIHDIERIKAEHMPAAADSSSADGLTDTTLAGSGTLSREAQIKLIDREGKEQIEHFANLFVSLDPAVFHELFTSQFDYAFQAMIEHCAAVSSVQVFVACDATSPAFISIMLRYLCDRLDLLGSDDEALTSTMLHLFKIAFLALAFFPEANEPVLQPYVQPIINSTLSTSKAAKKPENYFLLLRALFRSIGGGRYESLYKEVFPVLQSLLESLNAALGFTKRASPIQELFVEICLTVPVRLSVLLPYLSLLMKPLVFALESGPELVNQGLRTLELCIDNLTREFLDPILTPVIDEIMASLWIHLRLPSSASTHAPVAARILGKLGGRNRHMLLTRFPPATDEQIDINEEKFTVSFTFEGLPGLVDMPLIDAVVFSIKIMENRIATKQVDLARKDAVDFIVACARHVLALPSVAKGFVESASSQLLEQILGSCASIGDSCKAEALVTNGDAAVAMVSAATAVGATSLTGLSSNSCATNGNGFPISHGSLMCVIWALSLASTQSDVARGLLHTIISIGAKQHIIQCVDAVQSEKQQSGGNDNANDDNILLHATALADAVPEAISRVLVSKSDELRSTGCLMLKLYYSSLSESLQHSASLVGQLPAMRSIVSDLCAACYDPNAETKRSGCSGIAFIVKELNLGHTWLTDNLLELSKALLFTLKDTPTSIVCSTKAANSHETLLEIVKMALTSRLSIENSRLLKSFLVLIAKELANPSTEVREAAKACLSILVEVTGASVTVLLLPSRDRLLIPIFGKPLRALPHNMQIGNIDAITYCLSLDPPFLEINDELLRLLSEALALADAEDQALVNHPAQVRSNTISLTHLRHVCIRMLTAAMVRPEFSDAKNTPTRARIISVFFKSLYHKSKEVVDVANDGLKQVLLQQQKLPRDLLYTGLRPILFNLSDYKRLTVASLDGLARLLQLLTNYFKVEVGRKLLDHMQQWANPQFLQAASDKFIEDMHEIKILVAILQVFYLLPPTAVILLDDLVSSVVNLEVHLCRRRSSPFREPLFKFLNRYPTESVVYFVERIDSPHYVRVFAHAISSPECGPLREALINTRSINRAHRRLYNAMSALMLVRACLEYTPLWLADQNGLLQAMLATWNVANNTELAPSDSSRLARLILIEHLVHSLLLATRAMKCPPGILFQLLEIVGLSSEVIDVSFVFHYIWNELVVKWSIAKRREILSAFLVRLTDNTCSDDSNAILLRHLINPMVATVFTLPSIDLVDRAESQVISLIHQRVWAAHMSAGAQMSSATKASVRLELVQLSSILIRHATNAIADLRKDIIKFGWAFIRNDDIMIKNASYVLVAQFIAAFDTPPKIILQAYSSLLKAHHVESRFLVRQALDILLPVLPVRLGQPAYPPAGLPTWVLLAKRVLIDNSASLTHTTHVYQLIAAHPAIFFPYRMQFVSNLVGVLQKMCLTHSATPETRTLALDIMDLFLKWHDMLEGNDDMSNEQGGVNVLARSDAAQVGTSNGDDGTDTRDAVAKSTGTNIGTTGAPDLLMSEARRETIVGLLLRMLCLVFDFALKSNLGPRALDLLSRYLDVSKWLPMHLRLTFFERSIHQIEAQGMNQQLVLHILTVLSTVTAQMQPIWFEEYYGALVVLVRKCITVDNGQVQKIISKLLNQLYEQAADNEHLGNSTVVSDLKMHTEALISKNLQEGINIYGTLLMLHGIGGYAGEQFYSYIPLLMKYVQKYTKEHNTHAATAATATTAPALNSKTPLDILLMLVILLRNHIAHLGDQRRSFLTYIIQLIERSSDPALLHVILAIVREWVLDPQDAFPTIKEKAMLIDPFSLLERRYLALVLEAYNDPRFTRSEMTMRLEQAFLSGMQSEDCEMRNRFLDTFDANMPPSLPVRLNYLLETQNWESVSTTFWLQQCLPLLLASAHQRASLHSYVINRIGSNAKPGKFNVDGSAMDVDADLSTIPMPDNDSSCYADHNGLCSPANKRWSEATLSAVVTVGDIIGPLSKMVLLDAQFAYRIWIALFPLFWRNLSSKDRHDLTSGIIRLLAKPYHQAQTSMRPNVIQAILEAFCMCIPTPRLPPQLLRYLGQTYSSWYSALTLLEKKILDKREIESAIFDRAMGVELGAFDALSELYTCLSASHYFYGAWKRHCQYRESHIALAYEQLDDWANAQATYERAQTKARAGVLPFSESEYCLWESRWVETTKRLQSWDMLLDLGLHESLPEIELEAGWRMWDWNERQTQVRQLLKATPSEFSASPRAKFYETYLTLIKGGTERTKTADFQRMCKEGIKTCLQRWNDLPPVGTPAHIEILHLFQLMVELGDASNIYASLASTKSDNLESKSGDLKSVLQTWRERLPNNSDPINIWSDLVAWRQHVFKAINDVYVPFISQQSATGSSVLTSYAYRGYHEMAWIINRFAHVARLHNLIDVCINSLTRIYTLPNIEIQEAFLKLREQAKCYYDRPQELQSGLDVISNTNLVYFAADQKAEFYTLKGQFLAKLDKLDEANHAFATGIQYDLGSTKAWAAWGRYNDERFCKNMPDTTGAVNAISCYMQAAGLAKRPRVRRYLARTLWLLTQDDANGNVCAAFDAYKSEMPTWYWIAFVPQLLAGLDAPYHRQAQQILLRIAKQYPQALYYDLRTAREESLIFRRRQALNVGQGSAQGAEITTTGSNSGPPATEAAPNTSSGQPASAIDELMPKLKTAHPLLALSMETMIDQIVHRLKPCPEEDIYRLVHALLSDGLQQLYVNVSQGKFDLALVDTIVSNTCRVGLSLPSGAIKSRFERDFGKVREMDVCEYVAKLYQWQQMLRHAIRSRPKKLMLSLFSPFLVEFEQQKFEDVEVPGQYLRLTDNSDDFVRIERFIPELSFVLRSSNVSRCLAIRGTDSNIFYFAVQHVTSRHNHQEERWVQLYRNLDVASEQERDTWEQHRLALHLPTIVSLAPHIRLVQEHSDSFTLQDVYDTACTRNSTAEIAPALYFASKMRSLISQLPDIEEANLALFEQICQQFVPSSLLSNDVRLHAASSMEYWLYRENFSYQISVSIALSYIIASAQRTPAKLIVSRTSANICLSDLVPTQATPGLIHNKEAVPFRLTPNIQEFVTEFGLEGIVPFAIHKVVQRIAKKEYLLRDFLDLYVRDELMHMPNVKTLASTNPQALAEMCERNVQLIVHRANQLVETLPTKDVQDKELSPMQPLMQLLMKAVAPSNLAKMDFIWMPWL